MYVTIVEYSNVPDICLSSYDGDYVKQTFFYHT